MGLAANSFFFLSVICCAISVTSADDSFFSTILDPQASLSQIASSLGAHEVPLAVHGYVSGKQADEMDAQKLSLSRDEPNRNVVVNGRRLDTPSSACSGVGYQVWGNQTQYFCANVRLSREDYLTNVTDPDMGPFCYTNVTVTPFCYCPIDRTGSLCEAYEPVYCDIRQVAPASNCITQDSTFYHPDLAGDAPCVFVDRTATVNAIFTVQCGFEGSPIEGIKQDITDVSNPANLTVANPTFTYVFKTATLAQSTGGGNIQMDFRIVNFNRLSDAGGVFTVSNIQSTALSGQDNVGFTVNLASLSDDFFTSGRAYWELNLRNFQGLTDQFGGRGFFDLRGYVEPAGAQTGLPLHAVILLSTLIPAVVLCGAGGGAYWYFRKRNRVGVKSSKDD
eukprot:GILJ01001494.1.p1 GENE.GILJ01001494.1~~GILJ01001494.1.p1  ORF type:complete len:392 (+),score=34.21 GILJ01001494.1:105-1280(+)